MKIKFEFENIYMWLFFGAMMVIVIWGIVLSFGPPVVMLNNEPVPQWILDVYNFFITWQVLLGIGIIIAFGFIPWVRKKIFNYDNVLGAMLGNVLGAMLGVALGAVLSAMLIAMPGNVLGAVLGAMLGAVLGAMLGIVLGIVLGVVLESFLKKLCIGLKAALSALPSQKSE